MSISAYGEGEATSLLWLSRIWLASFERTRREDSFLGVIECNGTKLLPVTD